jgi:hypothetical protein
MHAHETMMSSEGGIDLIERGALPRSINNASVAHAALNLEAHALRTPTLDCRQRCIHATTYCCLQALNMSA